MSLFFESIKIENGQPANIFFHKERFNRTRRDVLGIDEKLSLEKVIEVPGNHKNKVYKCRLFYDYEVHKIEFVEYEKKNINKLIAVYDNTVSYNYKYTDRSAIEKLKNENTKNPGEEILIIKNGFITDTSYSNICFYDGQKWVTPQNPLLCGTQRAKLLTEKRIFEKEIRISELSFYKEIKEKQKML